MRRLASVLLVCIAGFLACSFAQTNSVPPVPTAGTNTVKTVPWLMATMDVETKQMVLTEPPAWMLAGPQTNEPTQVTIRIDCMDALTNVVVSGEFKTTRPVAFVQWKVIEE